MMIFLSRIVYYWQFCVTIITWTRRGRSVLLRNKGYLGVHRFYAVAIIIWVIGNHRFISVFPVRLTHQPFSFSLHFNDFLDKNHHIEI